MSSDPKKWYIHLGFNWSSPIIGSVWKNEPTEYRFLQYALAKHKDGTVPAWFKFDVNDSVYFYIWDLGSSKSYSPSALNIGFSELSSATADAPDTYVDWDTSQWSTETQDKSKGNYGSTYLQATPSSGTSGVTCPWDSSSASYSVTAYVKFNKACQCKLSFYLDVNDRAFISDPEVIVGSKGN